jgi:hypothetical protein
MTRAATILALALMAAPAVAQPPQFDPSKFPPPPRIQLPPELTRAKESPPAEWPGWAGWQSALGLFAACVVGGFLYGRFNRSD